jgi:putative aminopeptidase FrvX
LNKDILKKLCTAFGPVGRENAVADIIKAQLGNNGFAVKTDELGNIIATRGDAPYRVFVTHMDQPGWVVEHRDKKGILHLKSVPAKLNLGEGWAVDAAGNRYRVFVESELWRAESLVKDAGKMGTFLVPSPEFAESHDSYLATALGDRAGSAFLIEIAANTDNDQAVAFVFYTGRYLNFAGLTAPLDTLDIEQLYLVEPISCSEPGFITAEGAGMLMRSQRSIASSVWADEISSTASRIAIKLQAGFLADTASGADVLSRAGIPSLVLGVPVGYRSSRIERVAVSDCNDLVELLKAIASGKTGS